VIRVRCIYAVETRDYVPCLVVREHHHWPCNIFRIVSGGH
jgi:hypothetical protein